MSNRTDPTKHCAMCGREIEPHQMAYHVDKVEYGPRGGKTEHGVWGDVHEDCFLRRTGGKSLVGYLKKLAKGTKSAPKAARTDSAAP